MYEVYLLFHWSRMLQSFDQRTMTCFTLSHYSLFLFWFVCLFFFTKGTEEREKKRIINKKNRNNKEIYIYVVCVLYSPFKMQLNQ